MSTYTDMHRYVQFLESRWGQAKAWANWKDLQEDFLYFTPGAVMETLHLLYKSGLKYAPTPSEVLKAVQPVQARRIKDGTDQIEFECRSHVWAADVPEWECVNCGETTPAPECGHPYRGPKCPYCDSGLERGVV